MHTRSKANNVLNQLRYSKESYSSPSIPDYTIDLSDSMSSTGAPPPFRLRVRCRGKIHKYNMYEVHVVSLLSHTQLILTYSPHIVMLHPSPITNHPSSLFLLQMDPFSHVCTLLLADLKEDARQKVLLSHKTSTIKQTESPASLGLTTADILG